MGCPRRDIQATHKEIVRGEGAFSKWWQRDRPIKARCPLNAIWVVSEKAGAKIEPHPNPSAGDQAGCVKHRNPAAIALKMCLWCATKQVEVGIHRLHNLRSDEIGRDGAPTAGNWRSAVPIEEEKDLPRLIAGHGKAILSGRPSPASQLLRGTEKILERPRRGWSSDPSHGKGGSIIVQHPEVDTAGQAMQRESSTERRGQRRWIVGKRERRVGVDQRLEIECGRDRCRIGWAERGEAVSCCRDIDQPRWSVGGREDVSNTDEDPGVLRIEGRCQAANRLDGESRHPKRDARCTSWRYSRRRHGELIGGRAGLRLLGQALLPRALSRTQRCLGRLSFEQDSPRDSVEVIA